MTSRPLVYITRRIPQKGVDILLQGCDVKQWDSEEAAPRGELIHCVVGAEAILCMPCDVVDVRVLDAAGPQLRVIATISDSTDHINCEECAVRGIRIITCPLQPAENLAELMVALVLLTIKNTLTDEERQTLCRSFSVSEKGNGCTASNDINKVSNRPQLLRQMSQEQMAFEWSNGKPVNTNCLTWKTIAKKTFGIYGLTQTGNRVANLLKNIGIPSVLAADVNVKKSSDGSHSCGEVFGCGDCEDNGLYSIVPFDQLLSKCDIICVCGAVGPESDEIFSQESFKKMKKDAIFITSQSEESAVDYMSLYEALRYGQIRAAGLNDCNQIACPLKSMFQGLKNCIFLPQTLESVYDMRHKVSMLVARNLVQALNIVNGNNH